MVRLRRRPHPARPRQRGAADPTGSGTRSGHTGIAIKTGEGWLLHCGDAYFHHDELASPPSCPPGPTLLPEPQQRRPAPAAENQERLRELAARHGDEVRLLCSHDPHELDLRAGRRRRGRGVSGAAPRAALGAARRAGRALALDRVHALAARPSAASTSPPTTSSGAGRSTTSRPSGRRSGTSSGSRPTASTSASLGSREMPGASWFPGTEPQLRRARLRRQGRRRDRDPARLRAARARRAELGRAARPGRGGRGRACARLESSAATASSPTCRTSPRRSSPSSPPPAIGAIWSSCSPDFGPASVIDRFAQIEPKVLFAVDGYRYGGKDFDRRETIAELQAAMPSLRAHRRPPLPRPRSGPRRAARRDALGRAARYAARAPS